MYREGQKAAQVIRNLHIAGKAKKNPTKRLGHDSKNTGEWVPPGDDSSEWEEEEDRPHLGGPTPREPGSDSDVTAVLETTVGSYHSSNSSDEGDIPSEAEPPQLDEVYTEIDDPTPARQVRRSTRITRKPSRYTP